MRKLSSIPFKKGLLSFVCSAELHILDWRVQSRVDDWNLVRKQEPQIATCLKSLRGKTSSILEILAIANVDLPNYHHVLVSLTIPIPPLYLDDHRHTSSTFGILAIDPLVFKTFQNPFHSANPTIASMDHLDPFNHLSSSSFQSSKKSPFVAVSKKPLASEKAGFCCCWCWSSFSWSLWRIVVQSFFLKKPESGPWLIQSPTPKWSSEANEAVKAPDNTYI